MGLRAEQLSSLLGNTEVETAVPRKAREVEEEEAEARGECGRLFRAVRGDGEAKEEESSRDDATEEMRGGTRAREERNERVNTTIVHSVSIFKVVYAPRIVIRNQPNLNGHVVGVLRHGDFVEAVARCGQWLRLRNKRDDAGLNAAVPPIVIASQHLSDEKEWVLMHHPEMGKLLTFVAGARSLPEETLALPAPEPTLVETERIYIVAYQRVAVRSAASTDADILAVLHRGEYVTCNAELGAWVRVTVTRLHRPAVNGWMLTRHHELGTLLELHAAISGE